LADLAPDPVLGGGAGPGHRALVPPATEPGGAAHLLDEVIGVTRANLPPADVVNKLADNSVLGAVLAAGCAA
jgi:hypothetical protein